MAPSQLKQLKASLREKGIIGRPQTKKQKSKTGKNGAAAEKQRAQRAADLQSIREQFNPFEIKTSARPAKYQIANDKSGGGNGKGIQGHPGVTRALGEEKRRQTLLVEMQQRRRAGAITDRRFGENDPTMTPEERAAERFAKEKERQYKKSSMFNLEDDGEEEGLTHFGRSLTFDEQADDFEESDLSEGSETSDMGLNKRKRRLSDARDHEGDEIPASEGPERKKSKAEVMKEVIAKSKMYKYERQKIKEDDDELRQDLDQGLNDIFALLRTNQSPEQHSDSKPAETRKEEPSINADRAALIQGKDREEADREYDERLRQMVFDKRSKPTERTKTEEQRVQEEAQRLKELEEKRLMRMTGEGSSDEEEERPDVDDIVDDELPDDAKEFGLGAGIQANNVRKELDVEDEDEFVLDEDLIGNSSDVDLASSDDESENLEEVEDAESAEEEDDEEFVRGLLSKEEESKPEFQSNATLEIVMDDIKPSAQLAYTYACPQNHEEFLQIIKGTSIEDLRTIIQRIRALYHPSLKAENKEKMAIFADVLVRHLFYLANLEDHPAFGPLEQLIRHIHSLAKTQPIAVANSFRKQIEDYGENRPLKPLPGDLLILTGISSIFPTSDHFHQVVTPAMLLISRYLGQSSPQNLSDLAVGAYMGTLALQYQKLSKRYVPEFVNYVFNAIEVLCPTKYEASIGNIPYHAPPTSHRIQGLGNSSTVRPLSFWSVLPEYMASPESNETLKTSLLQTFLALVSTSLTLWSSLASFTEIFDPLRPLLKHLSSPKNITKLPAAIKTLLQTISLNLDISLQQSHDLRRPLLLHNHRPLPVKTAIPKFEESYDPTKHYDPDRERSELAKLKAEHKRERKGAMRELRKDANFIAREKLREKKANDEEYERKYKRLIAEIQGEEGHEKKEYEKEKRKRRGKF